MADRPIAKMRVRWSQLSFAFWDNDRKLPSITLTKSWRDDSGEWHNQNLNISRRDMVELAHQLPRAIALYDKTAAEMRQSSPQPTQPSPKPQSQPSKPTEVQVDVTKKKEETYEFIE